MKTFKEFINEKGMEWDELFYTPREINKVLYEEYDQLYPLPKDKTFTVEETLQIISYWNTMVGDEEFLTDRQQLAYITHKLNIL